MIKQVAANLRARKTSCAELVACSLSRIADRNHELNAFLFVDEEGARARARDLDDELAQGRDRGPLHGIPVGVKDLFDIKGQRTTSGSLIFKDHIATRNADVVDRLEAAGAVIVGKTGLHELAYGVSSSNPHFGPVRNPHNTAHVPGGSSGGSGAAVADGMVFMAMGTDTGGSIRIPAAYCGTFGIKPTYGLVSRRGCAPLGLTLDHMGPLTVDAEDALLTMNVLAGRPMQAPEDRKLRFGVPRNFYVEDLHEDVSAMFSRSMDSARKHNIELVDVDVPDVQALNTVSRVVLLAEAAAVMHKHLDSRDRFGPDVMALLDQGRLISAADYINAQRARRRFQIEFKRLFERIDILLTPATPIPAPRIGETAVMVAGKEQDARLIATRFVRGINALGLPATSMPNGKTRDGLPTGLQMVGRAGEDTTLLQAAMMFETFGR